MKEKWPVSETALGPPIKTWLEERGWTVYQEVELHTQGKRADIVGEKGSHLFVVELKKSMGLDVIAQAVHWRPYAHHVAVAVPVKMVKMFGRRHADHGDDARKLAGQVLEWKCLGLFEVERHVYRISGGTEERLEVHERRIAPFKQDVREGLQKRLVPERKDFAEAGNADAKRWTSFKATCEKLRKYVECNGPCELSVAIKDIQHHYSNNASARAALIGMFRKGVIKGLILDTETMIIGRV